MINWISLSDKHPGNVNKWVLVWDGKRIYPCLWVTRKYLPNEIIHGIKAKVYIEPYFKDMEMGCYAQGVTHWAELPIDSQQSLNPETEAPDLFKNIKEVKQMTDEFLTTISDKFPGIEWRVDVFSKVDKENEQEIYSIQNSLKDE